MWQVAFKKKQILTNRNSNDWKKQPKKSQKKLSHFDANDPVKYDFALFGLGVSGDDLNVATKNPN
ncbi:MAG: DUF2400 domain-containing protein [Bacillus subtilis]|nr:DUF2400 domain-containing protein [Bacillus subtilis]